MIATCDHKTMITANPGTTGYHLFDFCSLAPMQVSINVITFCISQINIEQTVQPPVSDYPKYKDTKCLLTRIEPQEFSLS